VDHENHFETEVDLDRAVAELEAAADAVMNAVITVIQQESMHPARAIYATAVALSSMIDGLPAVVRAQAGADVIRVIEGGLAEAAEAESKGATREPMLA
jgi:hypothetical protein